MAIVTQQLKKYNLDGECTGQIDLPESFSEVYANPQMIKDYIVAIRRNLRQWSANTKGKGEVIHSNQKPHRQKGTGNARQGSLASPQYKGGGRVFGPKPKFDQHVRINKKERRAIEKAKQGELIVLEDPVFDQPKTKTMVQFMSKAGLQGRSLFVLEAALAQFDEVIAPISISSDKYEAFRLSIRNLPRVYSALVYDLNGYQLMASRHVVMSSSAFDQLIEQEGDHE
jgi:large subunit ribosomal protein L4